MKLKPSTMLTIAIVLLSPSAEPLMRSYEVWGLIGWISVVLILAFEASRLRTQEKKLERSAT